MLYFRSLQEIVLVMLVSHESDSYIIYSIFGHIRMLNRLGMTLQGIYNCPSLVRIVVVDCLLHHSLVAVLACH